MSKERRDGDASTPGNVNSGDKLVFHYDRDRRLQNAPEPVRRMHEEGYTPNRGFIRGLTANAGLKSIFVTIIILSITAVALTLFGGQAGRVSVSGLEVRVRAFLYGDAVYVSVQLPENAKYSGQAMPVSAVLQGVVRNGTVVSERELAGVYTGSELLLRGILPDHQTERVMATVNIADSSGNTVVSVDRE